jgi:hypothetical protein
VCADMPPIPALIVPLAERTVVTVQREVDVLAVFRIKRMKAIRHNDRLWNVRRTRYLGERSEDNGRAARQRFPAPALLNGLPVFPRHPVVIVRGRFAASPQPARTVEKKRHTLASVRRLWQLPHLPGRLWWLT